MTSFNPVQTLLHRRLTVMEKFLLTIIVAYALLVSFANPQFLSMMTVFDMLRGGSGTMILAIAAFIVLISGGIDVSFTAIAVVSAYASTSLSLAIGIDDVFFILAVALLIGAALGFVNALLVQLLRLPTLIVTLGTASVFYGVMAVTLGTTAYTVNEMPASLVAFGSTNIVEFTIGGVRTGLSAFVPLVIAVLVLTWFVLYRTRMGRQIFALGNSEEFAARIGVRVFATRCFVYIASGALASIGGVMAFAEVKYVNPASIVGTELMVIAAVVIGGVRLFGGQGTLLGVILGVSLTELFTSTLVLLGLDSTWNNFFFGGVLLVCLGLMYSRIRHQNRRSLVFGEA